MSSAADRPNLLAYGDNLSVLDLHVDAESVDLIYLDPPFNSQRNYNVLFSHNGTKAAAQEQAFKDTWEWNDESAAAYREIVAKAGPTATVMRALHTVLMADNNKSLLAYLSMMAPRLLALRRVLKPTGSIYLHCDEGASAYLRLLMDSVFGARNFRNEIHWYYFNKMHDSRKRLFPRSTDTLLFYVKDVTSTFTFHQLSEKRDVPVRQLARKKLDGRLVNVRGDDGKLVYNLRDRKTMDNVWRIPMLQPAARERLGYPTQKPEALLGRVIEASSNPGDVVLDPFCGCGTAVAVAAEMKRRWIGIDVTYHAIGLIKHRLAVRYGDEIAKTYRVVGEPETVEDAAILARDDPFQFQSWALGLVGARAAVTTKRGGDGGIDGRHYYHDEPGGPTKEVILSVKAGRQLQPAFVRDLATVVRTENAEIGVLISFEDPTPGMRAVAIEAGVGHGPRGTFDRVQLRTIADLLAGHGIDYGTPEHREQAPVVGTTDRMFADSELGNARAMLSIRRRRSSRPTTPAKTKPDVSESPAAEWIREDYRQRDPSPTAPLSPRTSKRDRTVQRP
jgi:DNA modification methylase